VRQWIEEGAPYEPHWSFVPPVRPALPQAFTDAFCRTPVDAFVLHQLRRHGLEPSGPAAPQALLRRLFLALTGLPPEPADVDAFLQDPSPAAYDRWVDRLLDEEPYRTRFAERMASPWLDLARYADTCGIHMDAGRQMWAWRDWVLAAFRDNMPFDRFVVEQLAGDLLPDATQAQKVASGFNRCHVTTDEGGAIAEEYLVEYAVDRTATTGSVFLGLTLGCARCHEHKFDPISQDDFYRLYAYFDSIEEPGLYSQEKDSNRAFEPFMAVPSDEQRERRQALERDLAAGKHALTTPSPAEANEAAAWLAALTDRTHVRWHDATVAAATSTDGSTLTIEPDGSVLCSGNNPAQDHHEIRLATTATGMRLLCLEALPDAGSPGGKVGRAPNGNAVLNAIDVAAISVRDPQQRVPVPLVWAWADVEQDNGDHRVTNVLQHDDGVGWAVDAHRRAAGPCTALLLSDVPFGFDGGTELVVTLHYDSIYSQHTFARVRLSVGSIDDQALDLLPEATSAWFRAGPFPATGSEDAWEVGDGPERATALEREHSFTEDGDDDAAGDGAAAARPAPRRWRHEAAFDEGRANMLADGINRSYVAREWLVPTARTRELSLGSDDGFRLYVDGVEAAGRRVERSLAPDQDKVALQLAAGRHLVTMKIVNTGGNAGCYQRRLPRTTPLGDELSHDLVAALLPAAPRAALAASIAGAWRLQFSPGYREQQQRVQQLEQALAELDAATPRTMVMKERMQRRKTYVLMRGEYDKPDLQREVTRGVPAALGPLPAGAPDDRRGLAQWLVAESNPLFTRVQVNRLFELVFGTGIVRTSEDFGMQGEWPSNRALLDWLACEFRSAGFDVRHMLRLLCKSGTFRQQNRVRADARAADPDDRLLAYFPRRRLAAEQLRDQALFVSGLLVERLGGPSVKPYQPQGLWQEVAMPQSNTRTFEAGSGDALWRRSLYTYYKRACPPPSMLTFDAPTREFCTVRRLTTNTPLQALVLWNDEQFVEAARALAQRSLDDGTNDDARIASMCVRCTGERPDAAALLRTKAALATFRARFAAAPADADALLQLGRAPLRKDVPAPELAALTLLASAILNLDATICTP
jgi:hypothetical protein